MRGTGYITRILIVIAMVLGVLWIFETYSLDRRAELLCLAGVAITGSALLLLHHRKRISDRMTGREFELWCAAYLKEKGFRKIEVTQASVDYGADIIATDRRGRRWVFQCKKYGKNVGNAAVQEVVAARAHYDADRAAVMTNAYLTRNAKALAEENEVRVIEGLR